MIPLWAWAGFAILLVLALAWVDTRRITSRRDNYSAVEAERLAREAAAPLGNVERVWP